MTARDGETVDQYKFRFRQEMLYQVYRHGVNVEDSVEVLNRLGTNLPLGRGVVLRNWWDTEQLPDGALVYTGEPRLLRGYAVFVKQDRRWQPVLHVEPGSRLMSGVDITVHTLPDTDMPPDWLIAAPTEDTPKQIARFQIEAWRAGMALKKRRQWCGTFDSVFNGFGLNTHVIRQAADLADPPDVLTPEQVNELPVGTVLRNVAGDTWFIRAEDSTNRAGTRRLFGAHGGGHFVTQMVVIGPTRADGRLDLVPEWTDALFNSLPPGSLLRYEGYTYVICSDGKARQGSHYTPGDLGIHPLSAFNYGTGELSIRRFGDRT